MVNSNLKNMEHLVSNSEDFFIQVSESGNLSVIRHPQDPHQMNWVGDIEWGKIQNNVDLDVTVERSYTSDGKMKETYIFTNNTDYDIYLKNDDIGIYTPIPDQYESSDISLTQRANAHIWCGEQTSYIMGLRMGGEAPHLGLILTNGSINNYSIDRNFNESSNHRGNIILHPSPRILLPGEEYLIEWELFWHDGKDDFYRQVKQYSSYLHVEAERYVMFQGENNKIEIQHAHSQVDNIKVKRNGENIPYRIMLLEIE